MNAADAIDRNQLEEGLRLLNILAQEEYEVELSSLLNDLSRDQDVPLWQLGRLLGVAVKEPFAEPRSMEPSTSFTRARRAWLLDEHRFDEADKQRTWQFEVLDKVRMSEPMGLRWNSVRELAENAQHERGFFKYLALSCHKYLCGDAALKKRIDESVQEIQHAGGAAQVLSPSVMISAAATSLAAALVQAVPWLTTASLPLVAGFVVLIATIGLDAFCSWSTDRLKNVPDTQS